MNGKAEAYAFAFGGMVRLAWLFGSHVYKRVARGFGQRSGRPFGVAGA